MNLARIGIVHYLIPTRFQEITYASRLKKPFMEVQRPARYPIRGRAQVAIPNHVVLPGHTLDISIGGVCIVVDEKLPLNISYPIRFEMTVNGKVEVITTTARAVYGVFASQGGFRVGFQFIDAEPKRTDLIKALAGKKPMLNPSTKQTAPKTGQTESV